MLFRSAFQIARPGVADARQVREEGGGSAENSIHPPAHCLPGSGWDLIHVETVELDLPGLPQNPAFVKRLLIAKGDAPEGCIFCTLPAAKAS